MSMRNILKSVADQVNAGALGPNVTASVSGGYEPSKPSGNGHKLATPALPEPILDTFRQHRGGSDHTQWRLGDAVADAIVEMAGKVTQRRIYQAAAIETDYSIAEIRMLHETARGTDQSLRDEFDSVLVHAHYRVLRFIDDRGKKRAYLRWCVESADQFNGRPAPAAVLAKKVQKEMGLEPPPPTVGEILERATAQLDRAWDTDPAAVLRELSRYVDGKSENPMAGKATSDLRMAASELKTAAPRWGKTE